MCRAVWSSSLFSAFCVGWFHLPHIGVGETRAGYCVNTKYRRKHKIIRHGCSQQQYSDHTSSLLWLLSQVFTITQNLSICNQKSIDDGPHSLMVDVFGASG